jgi:L-tartrate/succinate antiporter
MGKSTLGLGYAVAFSDLVLAPFMPSNTARSGGSIYPVAINIPQIFSIILKTNISKDNM